MNILMLENLLSRAKFAHPDDSELAAFEDGTLPHAVGEKIRAHMAICPACRGRLDFMRELLATPTTTEPLPETLVIIRKIVSQPRGDAIGQIALSICDSFDVEAPSYYRHSDELAAAAQPEETEDATAGREPGVLTSVPPSIECPLPKGGFLYGDFETGEGEQLVLELRSVAPEMRGAKVLIQFQTEDADLRPLGETILESPRAAPGGSVYSGLVSFRRDQIVGRGMLKFRVTNPTAHPGSKASE